MQKSFLIIGTLLCLLFSQCTSPDTSGPCDHNLMYLSAFEIIYFPQDSAGVPWDNFSNHPNLLPKITIGDSLPWTAPYAQEGIQGQIYHYDISPPLTIYEGDQMKVNVYDRLPNGSDKVMITHNIFNPGKYCIGAVETINTQKGFTPVDSSKLFIFKFYYQ